MPATKPRMPLVAELIAKVGRELEAHYEEDPIGYAREYGYLRDTASDVDGESDPEVSDAWTTDDEDDDVLSANGEDLHSEEDDSDDGCFCEPDGSMCGTCVADFNMTQGTRDLASLGITSEAQGVSWYFTEGDELSTASSATALPYEDNTISDEIGTYQWWEAPETGTMSLGHSGPRPPLPQGKFIEVSKPLETHWDISVNTLEEGEWTLVDVYEYGDSNAGEMMHKFVPDADDDGEDVAEDIEEKVVDEKGLEDDVCGCGGWGCKKCDAETSADDRSGWGDGEKGKWDAGLSWGGVVDRDDGVKKTLST